MKPNVTRLSLLAALLAPATSFAGQTQITSATPGHHENILDAAELLENMFGEVAVAAAIRARLASGGFYFEADPMDANAETTSNIVGTVWTTIQDDAVQCRATQISIVSGARWQPNPGSEFQALLSLARLLFHEEVHAGQSAWTRALSSSSEPPAWGATITALLRWDARLEADYEDLLNFASPCERKQILRYRSGILGMVITYIGEYLAKSYARTPLSWRAVSAQASIHKTFVNTALSALEDEIAANGILCATTIEIYCIAPTTPVTINTTVTPALPTGGLEKPIGGNSLVRPQ